MSILGSSRSLSGSERALVAHLLGHRPLIPIEVGGMPQAKTGSGQAGTDNLIASMHYDRSLVDRCRHRRGWCRLPTPVQQEAMPLILTGGDVMAAAETGSGKTGAFALPVLQIVHETLRARQTGSSDARLG